MIMFVMLVVSFGLGFLLKPFLKRTYLKYLPFMVAYMKGDLWPIRYIQASVAVKIFPVLPVLDIAGLLFGFSVYMGMPGTGGKR